MTFSDAWKLYFHDPYGEDWECSGYVPLFTCNCIEEFHMMESQLKNILVNGMFFCMRSNIFPKWNDEANKNGGFLSIKILKERMSTFSLNLMFKLMNDTLLKAEHRHLTRWINGISISPKKNFSIVKIWVGNNTELCESDMFDIEHEYHGEIIFKTNTCN